MVSYEQVSCILVYRTRSCVPFNDLFRGLSRSHTMNRTISINNVWTAFEPARNILAAIGIRQEIEHPPERVFFRQSLINCVQVARVLRYLSEALRCFPIKHRDLFHYLLLIALETETGNGHPTIIDCSVLAGHYDLFW